VKAGPTFSAATPALPNDPLPHSTSLPSDKRPSWPSRSEPLPRMLDCWGSSPIGDGCSNLPLFRVDHRVSSSPWACTLSEQAKEDDVHPTATTFLSPSFSKKHPRIFSTKLPQACKQVMSPFPPFSSSQLEISSRAVEPSTILFSR
jgi:hypothetical protein